MPSTRRRSAGGDVRQRRPQHAGGSALHAVGGRAAQAADGHLLQGQPRRQLPADRVHAAAHALAAAQDRPDQGRHAHCYEANCGLRQIFLDGRTLPTNDPQPFWQGYSVGRWDGDTLVVETIGFRDDGWLDVDGSYFGSTTKVTERFRRVNYGRLELDITVEDAKAYTSPWTVRVNWRLIPDSS